MIRLFAHARYATPSTIESARPTAFFTQHDVEESRNDEGPENQTKQNSSTSQKEVEMSPTYGAVREEEHLVENFYTSRWEALADGVYT